MAGDLDPFSVMGVEIEYYFSCPTELWLYSHNLNMSTLTSNESIKEGKIIHDLKYGGERKEVMLGRSKIDVLKVGNRYIVYEIKREKFSTQHEMQLKFYMYLLHLKGIESSGILVAKGKRKIIHSLTEEDISKINEAIKGVYKIRDLPSPPKPVKKALCKTCAYYDFCFGDRDE